MKELRRFPARAFAIAIAVGFTAGCMTIDTQTAADYAGPRIYSGTRVNLDQFGKGLLGFDSRMFIFGFDLPLSLVADTLILPITIPDENRRQLEIALRTQTVEERPSVIEVATDSDPLDAARRLFEACTYRLEHWDPQLTDCYSLRAKIFYESGKPSAASGAQFKPLIRAAMADLQYAGDFVTWRDETFTREGDAVRVDARAASGSRGDLGPISLLLGASGDGGWRIMEHRGARWR